MEIRKYLPGEEQQIWDIFFSTVHNINSRDYTRQQVAAWAPPDLDEQVWSKKITEIDPYVVVNIDEVVAYGDIQNDGYIDHFFCHHKYQRQGIGSLLFSHLYTTAIDREIGVLSSDVSITAKPFFEAKGFSLVHEQLLSMRGQQLINYRMIRNMRGHSGQ